MQYLSPKTQCEFEQVIKHSRFIAKLSPIQSAQDAKLWLKECHTSYPDARHICWAYIAGAPNTTEQSMSDDGEPSGTAGKPILNVLQHADIGDIAVAVIRYFGGVKLGTGGLVRAYSSSTVEVLKLATLTLTEKQKKLSFSLAFADESVLRHHLQCINGKLISIDYKEIITAHCLIAASQETSFLQSLPHTIQFIDHV